MLNRYGLIDIDAILNEGGSDVGQFQTQHGDTINGLAQDHTQIGKMKGTGYMAGRFKSAPATDSSVADKSAATDKRGDRDAARQTLRTAHERSGMKASFHQVFDKKTTGLDGQAHIGVISYLHDGDHKPGKNNTGSIEMQSPGDAQNMAKAGGHHHSNLTFSVDSQRPHIVSYKPAPAPAPQQPGGDAATGGPMGAPVGTPGPVSAPAQPPPLY
jgi:hypothetical protein